LLVVAYKMRHTRTYNDCRDYYEKVMNKGWQKVNPMV
jgi:hypothetical protein